MKRRHCLVFFHKYTWVKRICRSRCGTKFREVENEQASQVALMVKNLPANVGDIRDMGSIMGQEDPLEEGMATHSRILAWRIP